MPVSEEFQQPAPAIFTWQSYDPAVKVELWSTAITVPGRLYFFDPIPLAESALAELCQARSPAAVILTNCNHSRAAAEYSDKFRIPVFSGADLTEKVAPGLEIIPIEGGVAGEVAVFQPATNTLVVGDALINFEPPGLAFLPKKYCCNEKQMQRSLRQLLEIKVRRIFFAHGQPILVRAAEKLQALLEL
jgi:glyoxylase-like metal-dependent hydrolase (beta-lactamase superfamily II)